MAKNMSDIVNGMSPEAVNKAFQQIYGNEMTDTVQAKENQVKSKTVELQPQLKFQYEFAQTVDENSGEIQYGQFDFADVFKGMSEAFEQIENQWAKFKAEKGKYSKDYVNSQRDQLFVEVLELKSKYQQRYRDTIKQLKSPTKTQKLMSYTDENTNELKRSNNIKMMEHFLNTCNIQQLRDLYHYQNNKEVYDIVLMLLTKLDSMIKNETNHNVKRDITALKNEVHQDIAKRANPEYYQELEKIEFNLDYIFNQDKFPAGLENGMYNITYTAVLPS